MESFLYVQIFFYLKGIIVCTYCKNYKKKLT